ncbi:MAG: virulence protein RhuM/Fic/DOC family protein [Sulfurospirillum sp.]|nr:virulence protein RhuM/Fic/DOC family protein [Sulfurospirillum sp.]
MSNIKNKIVIYEDGELNISTKMENETIWVTQKQMQEIFGRERSVITKHINNIFKDEELDKNSVCAFFAHTADDNKIYNVQYHNLDMIITVGYRVNSKKATKFRQWATQVLKQYIINGYVVNKEHLQASKLNELTQMLKLIEQSIKNQAVETSEAKGFVEIISKYAKSWALLQGYDEQSLEEITQTKEQKFILDYDESVEAITQFKSTLISKGEATELFGQEKAGEFKGNLLNIYQSFGGIDLLPSVEQKAANLLYYIVKGHPFNDGNKRIGAFLFILFLHKNGILHKANNEPKINDNALASLTLLVATSNPAQKDIIIRLIMNILYDGDVNV